MYQSCLIALHSLLIPSVKQNLKSPRLFFMQSDSKTHSTIISFKSWQAGLYANFDGPIQLSTF